MMMRGTTNMNEIQLYFHFNRMLCYRLGGAVLIRVVRWALPTPCTVTRFQSGLEPLEVVFCRGSQVR